MELYLLFGLRVVKRWVRELDLVEEIVYKGLVGLVWGTIGYDESEEVVLEGLLKGLKRILLVILA